MCRYHNFHTHLPFLHLELIVGLLVFFDTCLCKIDKDFIFVPVVNAIIFVDHVIVTFVLFVIGFIFIYQIDSHALVIGR